MAAARAAGGAPGISPDKGYYVKYKNVNATSFFFCPRPFAVALALAPLVS